MHNVQIKRGHSQCTNNKHISSLKFKHLNINVVCLVEGMEKLKCERKKK